MGVDGAVDLITLAYAAKQDGKQVLLDGDGNAGIKGSLLEDSTSIAGSQTEPVFDHSQNRAFILPDEKNQNKAKAVFPATIKENEGVPQNESVGNRFHYEVKEAIVRTEDGTTTRTKFDEPVMLDNPPKKEQLKVLESKIDTSANQKNEKVGKAENSNKLQEAIEQFRKEYIGFKKIKLCDSGKLEATIDGLAGALATNKDKPGTKPVPQSGGRGK